MIKFSLGLNLIKRRINSPFLNVVYSKHYSDLVTAMKDVELCGLRVRAQGLPKELGPCVIVVTGAGNSARGALEVLDQLHGEATKVEDLPGLFSGEKGCYDPRKVYIVQATSEDFVVRRDGGAFDKAEYYADPSKYSCRFEEKVLPYATLIINCIFWNTRFERLVTKAGLRRLCESGNHRLVAVCDVSCDLEGSMEFTTEATTIDHPLFFFDPASGLSAQEPGPSLGQMSIAVCSIDHLPAELPRSASEFFSGQLTPFLKAVATTAVGGELQPELQKAIICENGALAPRFAHITQLRADAARATKRVVIFGAGRMVEPVVEFLVRDPATRVTVASMLLEEAEALCRGREGQCSAVQVTVTSEPERVAALVRAHAVVVSLLPASLHELVAGPAVAAGVHVVTASYISDGMRALHAEAERRGVTVLGEMGLDPGIDHMSLMALIDEARAGGARVRAVQSWCGGLPSPQDCDNPWLYKFSWAPRSALAACKNGAKWLWDGATKEVPAPDLFRATRPVHVSYLPLDLEGYPNRDSTTYVKDYNLEGVDTLIRGTLRFAGFSNIMYGLVHIGLLDDRPQAHLAPGAAPLSWPAALAKLMGCGADLPALSAAVRARVGDLDAARVDRILSALRWLGCLSEASPCPLRGTYLDALCAAMEAKMGYGPREVDLVLMIHSLEVVNPDGSVELWTATLAEYGRVGGPTAMSRTVGLPVAAAVRLLLDAPGDIPKGVIRPTNPKIYEPVLKTLDKEGIRFKESRNPFFKENAMADFSKELAH